MTTKSAIIAGSLFSEGLNLVHQQFPSLVPTARTLAGVAEQAASSIPGSDSITKLVLAPVPFQFPVSSHPLAELAAAIQSIKEGRMSLETFQRSYENLDPASKKLFSERNIEVVGRNLRPLSQLLTLIDQTSDKTAIFKCFYSTLDEDARNLLAGHIYDLSKDPGKGGKHWGIEHAVDDLACLKDAILRCIDRNCLTLCSGRIKAFAIARLQALPKDEKNAIYGTVYQIGGRPKTSDLQWGEHQSAVELKRLVSALHCHAKIKGPLLSAQYLKNWEKQGSDASQYFSIEGNELPQGEISFLNGMGTTFLRAKQIAQQLKNDHCQGFAMHCVYAATQGFWDLPSATLGQNLHLLPQGRLLIQRWTEFFARANPHDRYLQICTSRGAIDVAAALAVLPRELQQRIIVITIGPGYIIEHGTCYKAVNLIVKEDPIPYLAPNHALIKEGEEEIMILPNHSRGANPHNPHGSSYTRVLSPLIDQYIHTNDIDLSFGQTRFLK